MAAGSMTLLPNDVARTLFLATAIPNNYTIPVQTYNSSGTMSFLLPNTGFTRHLRVHVGGTIQAGTAAATAGVRWPFSLFANAQLIDPSNQIRMAVKPWHAYRLQVIKRPSWFYDKLANITGGSGGMLNNYKQVLNPLPLGAIGTGSATNVSGFFDLPIILNHNDLRGGFRADVPQGQTLLNLTPATTVSSGTAGMDIPITLGASGTINLASLTVKVNYYYYDPVAVQVNPGEVAQIPYPTGKGKGPNGTNLIGDMEYVHELLSAVSTGLVAGQEYLWALGTNREYFRLFHWFNNAGTVEDFSQGYFTLKRFLLNANTPKGSEDMQEYLSWYFEQTGTLPQDEEFYWNFYKRPWDSNQYGQLQTGLTLSPTATVNAGAFLETMRETLYVQL